jgi:small conductance mechanosensitive channel
MPQLWDALRKDLPLYAGKLLAVVVVIALGWLVLRYLVGPLRRLLGRSRLDQAVASFVLNSARALILVAVLLAVLQQVGVEATSLLALLGAAGLAIALSLQTSLANFASGLVLLAFRTVRVGDHIEVGDVRAQVRELLPFHVVVDTPDNQRITLPNTLLANGPVRNNSALPNRRAQWALTVPARYDLAAVRSALLACLRADPRVLAEPPPQVYVQEWAEDRRVLAVQAWAPTDEHPLVQQSLLEELGKALEGVRPRE